MEFRNNREKLQHRTRELRYGNTIKTGVQAIRPLRFSCRRIGMVILCLCMYVCTSYVGLLIHMCAGWACVTHAPFMKPTSRYDRARTLHVAVLRH